MIELNEIYLNKPGRSQINLQFMHIKDLTPFVILLQKFPNLQSLSLHGNQIKYLPNLSTLQSLLSLNLTKNPLKIDTHLLNSLYKIPKLIKLYIDANAQELRRIIQSLPNLINLNEKPVIRIVQQIAEKQQRRKRRIIQIQNFIKKAEGFYKQLDFTEVGVKPQNSFYLQSQVIKAQYLQFQQNVKNNNTLEAAKAYAKQKILQILDERLISFIHDSNQTSRLGKIIESVFELRKENLEMVLRRIFNDSYNQLNKPQDNTIPKYHLVRQEDLYQKQVFRLKKQLTNCRVKIAELELYNESLLKKITQLTIKKFKLNKDRKTINTPSRNTPIGQTPRLIKNKSNLFGINNQISRQNLQRKQSLSPVSFNKSQSRSLLKNNTSKALINSPFQNQNVKKKPLQKQNVLQLIQEIISKKVQQNKYYFNKKEKYQTLQQFLFTFFFRKYGLKQLALSSSVHFIQSIEKYAKQDIYITIFGKILRHQLEQDFYDKQFIFMENLNSLFKRQIKSKKVNQKERLNIIRKIFSDYPDEITRQKLSEDNFDENIEKLIQKCGRLNIEFHEMFIEPLLQIIKKYDSDSDGALTRSQVSKALKDWKILKQQSRNQETIDINNLLNIVDPNKTDKIPFSLLIDQLINKKR